MEKKGKTKQRFLQIFIAVVLVMIAVLVEMIGIHPEGIYYYQTKGYRQFQIGREKKAVLWQINLEKAIREIRACDPDIRVIKKDRKRIELSRDLQASDIWMCYDRTGKQFLFVFKDGKLNRLLIQRLRSGNKNGLPIFKDCRPEDVRSLDAYLATQTQLQVYGKD